MEEKITLLIRDLKRLFWGVFLSSATIGFLLIYFISNIIIEEPLSIKLQSAAILVLLAAIPLALWLYNKKVTTATLPDNENQKTELIRKWFIIRLALVETAFMFNIVVYALTKDNSLLYCSGIALLFLFFLCKPGRTEITQLLSED